MSADITLIVDMVTVHGQIMLGILFDRAGYWLGVYAGGFAQLDGT